MRFSKSKCYIINLFLVKTQKKQKETKKNKKRESVHKQYLIYILSFFSYNITYMIIA